MVDVITIIVGISLGLVAAFLFNVAVVLQKKGLLNGPEINFESGIVGLLKTFKELFQNKAWISGFLLGVIAWFPYVVAIGMVSILVVSPLISVGLIVFVIAANKILGEKVSFYEFIAIITLMIAPILIAFAGISRVFIDLFNFLIPLIVFLIIALSASILCFVFSKKNRNTQKEGLFLVFAGAILYSLGIVFTNVFTQALHDADANPIFFWEILFGIFWFFLTSSYAHLWVFLGFWAMVFFNAVSIVFYQAGFQKGKTILLFPIFNILTLILPIMAGLLVFGQIVNNYYLFFIAIIMILFSTLVLSKFQGKIESIEKL